MALPLIALLALVLSGCSPEAGEPRAPEASARPLPAAGFPGPEILRPRQRVLSATPGLLIVTPGLPGPVEIAIGRSSGLRRRFRSRGRSLPWPEGWPGLEPGEAGWIAVTAGGRRAHAGFVRVVAPPGPEWLDGPEPAVRALLARGLWAEAVRLAAMEQLPETPALVRARRRAGMPNWGLWRQLGEADILPGEIRVP